MRDRQRTGSSAFASVGVPLTPAARILQEGGMHVPAALRAEGIIASSKTWLRWKIHGVNGAKLETIKVGGRLFTSRAAVLRFVEAQQREAPPAQQTLDARAADVVLAAHGLRREAKP